MKKFLVFLLISVVSGFFLIACQRGGTVQAGREEKPDYQPLPAPKGEVMPGAPAQAGTQAIKGELMRVDSAKKTISIRAENGMEQTFKFDDKTTVVGMEQTQPGKRQKQTAKANQVGDLVGKEGSEVRILWREEDGVKMAINVNLMHENPKYPTTK